MWVCLPVWAPRSTSGLKHYDRQAESSMCTVAWWLDCDVTVSIFVCFVQITMKRMLLPADGRGFSVLWDLVSGVNCVRRLRLILHGTLPYFEDLAGAHKQVDNGITENGFSYLGTNLHTGLSNMMHFQDEEEWKTKCIYILGNYHAYLVECRWKI